MESEAKWMLEYKAEIALAHRARNKGNEGMARVCARRAAGVVIGEFLIERGHSNIGKSVVDRVRIFNSISEVDQQSKVIASHFLLKVGTDRQLPIEADLIHDAEWLANSLLLENNK